MIHDDRQRRLWKLLDHARSRPEGFGDLFQMAAFLRESGEVLTLDDLAFLARRFIGVRGGMVPPPFLTRFIAELLASREALTVLDPCADLGWLPAAVADKGRFNRFDAICKRSDASKFQEVFASPARYSVHIGDPASVLPTLNMGYDAIISMPPIGQPREHRSVPGISAELRDDPALLLIPEAAAFLADGGVFLWVVPPRFAFERSRISVRHNLVRFGLHLSALLRIPPKAFLPMTSMSFELALIERRKRPNLFVAEIPEQPDAQDQLIERLRAREEGPQASQGRLVKEAEFFGLGALEATERAQRLAAGKGLEPVPFATAIIQVNRPRRCDRQIERLEEHPDAVYLPEMARTLATTSQDQLPERLQSYLQLILNREVVEPQYLAGLFNTPLGLALRDAARGGTTIPRISRQRLEVSTLYLPPLKDQKDAIEALGTIDRFRAELSELEARIWDRPRKADQVVEGLTRINREERFEGWVESLPFPLASILRAYHATDRTDKDRYERLLHFFEALAEFLATLHLSAFMSDAASWESRRDDLSGCLRSQHLSFKHSTFGLWKAVTEYLSGEARKLISDDPSQVCSLYRVVDLLPIERIVSRGVLGILQRTNASRNRWTGHGGAVSENEAVRRHVELRQEVEKIREVLGPAFGHYQLIQPREAEVLPGPVFRCSVRRIMGSNPQFEHAVVELGEPAITNRLYMYNLGHTQALEIAPLVQIRKTPQPACYFYNHLEQDGLHLVSYHFAEKAEDVDASPETNAFMIELNQTLSAIKEE